MSEAEKDAAYEAARAAVHAAVSAGWDPDALIERLHTDSFDALGSLSREEVENRGK